jgi:tagatose-1,6-bisphosphate aldolase
MKAISIGKLRGLQQISSSRGTFTALALGHRQNLRKANPALVDNSALSRFKLDVTSALASYWTAVLLDPEISAAQAVGAGDSFDAGFIYGYLNGWELEKSLRLACVCGALSTQAAGGTTAQPTLEETMKFL